MDYLVIAASILGSLGVSSVVAQYFAGGQQRREVRGLVLERLAAVESARWESDVGLLMTATRSLESAALIARVPRRTIERYIELAQVAQRNLQDTGDPDIGFFIDNSVADQVRTAAEDVATLVWSPGFFWVKARAMWRRLDKGPA